MSQFCKLCMHGNTFIAKTCPRDNCKFNKGHNNNNKEDRGKKDEQTKRSI